MGSAATFRRSIGKEGRSEAKIQALLFSQRLAPRTGRARVPTFAVSARLGTLPFSAYLGACRMESRDLAPSEDSRVNFPPRSLSSEVAPPSGCGRFSPPM